MLSHLLCVQLSLFILFRPKCVMLSLFILQCVLLPTDLAHHSGQEQEHADSERQGPHVHQEVGAWQAEQTQDPSQHQEEVHQRRVRCFLYIMHCWCFWDIFVFWRKKNYHTVPHSGRSEVSLTRKHVSSKRTLRWNCILFTYFRSEIFNSLWQNIYINCAGVHANLDLSMSRL